MLTSWTIIHSMIVLFFRGISYVKHQLITRKIFKIEDMVSLLLGLEGSCYPFILDACGDYKWKIIVLSSLTHISHANSSTMILSNASKWRRYYGLNKLELTLTHFTSTLEEKGREGSKLEFKRRFRLKVQEEAKKGTKVTFIAHLQKGNHLADWAGH